MAEVTSSSSSSRHSSSSSSLGDSGGGSTPDMERVSLRDARSGFFLEAGAERGGPCCRSKHHSIDLIQLTGETMLSKAFSAIRTNLFLPFQTSGSQFFCRVVLTERFSLVFCWSACFFRNPPGILCRSAIS